jgi:hypothetical protein
VACGLGTARSHLHQAACRHAVIDLSSVVDLSLATFATRKTCPKWREHDVHAGHQHQLPGLPLVVDRAWICQQDAEIARSAQFSVKASLCMTRLRGGADVVVARRQQIAGSTQLGEMTQGHGVAELTRPSQIIDRRSPKTASPRKVMSTVDLAAMGLINDRARVLCRR